MSLDWKGMAYSVSERERNAIINVTPSPGPNSSPEPLTNSVEMETFRENKTSTIEMKQECDGVVNDGDVNKTQNAVIS